MLNIRISRDESTILKGIAILTVILAHANGWGHAFVSIPLLKSADAMGFLCQGGMTLFLFMSGYGLYQSYSSKKLLNYWDNKISKVFIPAVIIQALWVIAYSVYSGQFWRIVEGTGESFFAEIICINSSNNFDGTMWYLSYLLFCYLVFYCFAKLSGNRFNIIFFLIIWSILVPLCFVLWPDCRRYIMAFSLGVVYSYLIKDADKELSRLHFGMAACIGIILSPFYFALFLEKSYFIDNVAGTVLAASMIMLVKLIGAEHLSVLKWIGNISFYIYLIEGKIMFGWFNYDSHSEIVRLGVLIVLMAITVFVSDISNRWFGKLFKG